MSATKRGLEDAVSAVFERACREGDIAVAEHLPCALEVIAHRGDEKNRLQHAFLTMARSLSMRSTQCMCWSAGCAC